MKLYLRVLDGVKKLPFGGIDVACLTNKYVVCKATLHA